MVIYMGPAHWLVHLLLFFSPLALIWYSEARLGRAGLAVRLLVLAAAAAAWFGLSDVGFPDYWYALPVMQLLLYRWTVTRLNDVGWSRWIALVWFFVLFGVLFVLPLCFVPADAGRDAEAPPDPARPRGPASAMRRPT